MSASNIVHRLGLISPTSETFGLFCVQVVEKWGVSFLVILFATVVTVIGQRIPDILKLIMMAPYSLN
jgi:hypothetical protein